MFKSFAGENGWYGVEDEHGAVLYEADTFDTKREADLYADAHNNGARSYLEASAMIEGTDEGEAVEHTLAPDKGQASDSNGQMTLPLAGKA